MTKKQQKELESMNGHSLELGRRLRLTVTEFVRFIKSRGTQLTFARIVLIETLGDPSAVKR